MRDTEKHEAQYDCWFQRRAGHSLSFSERVLNRIVLVSPPGNGIIANASEELRWGLQKLFAVAANAESGTAEKSGVFLGLAADLGGALDVSFPTQKAEGFIIRAEENRVLIAGADAAGCLYGVYRFLILLALGKLRPGIEIADAPAASFRGINHWDNLDGSVERGYAGPSLFFKDNRVEYDPARIKDYARLLASVGINRLSLNNVNVRGAAKRLITEEYLPNLAELAGIFRPFGVRLLLSVNFSSPQSLGGLSTADPLEPLVAEWWKKQTALVYRYIPDLAGFLVKADSEGESGPFQYGRSHAEGANMLAAALRPYNAPLIWRCFVYNSAQDWRDPKIDRARAAYDHFMPLDGEFAENVILQIKHGPYDFQVREPVSPLFGALKKTRCLMELQITQEYTGHQIDLCFLPSMWEWVMNFDTGRGENAHIKNMIGDAAGGKIEGLAGVGSAGLDRNWTAHPLAQANLYGYGRLAWRPSISAEEIAGEWSALTFGDGASSVSAAKLLLDSYHVYEKYTSPFGVCFMVTPGLHYGPDVEGYEFSKWGTYHRANREEIGVDRTKRGTGFTEQYAPKNAALFGNVESCPENLLLFFHRLRYDFKMKNGQSLLQNIYNNHFEGYDEARRMYEAWLLLEGGMDTAVFETVKARMLRQLDNARQWRDVINTYFFRKTGTPDQYGRGIYP